MFDKISNYMTDMIYETLPDVDPGRREVIEYGVYMIASEIIKVSIVIILGIILGILPYVLGTIAICGIQRTFLGGIHSKTHLGCVIAQTSIVFGVLTASYISNINRLYLLIPVAIFSFITAYKYAPADLPQKPIKSKRQRLQLRVGGFILLTALFTASYFVPQIWSNIIMFSCVTQAFFMTPFAYKITKNRYGREETSA
ncbi:MAG TPA: accessory gene regulator B family protein [Clostridia bacterium]|nr:accessory gene regulator B family protein [Clostridia bacterium]